MLFCYMYRRKPNKDDSVDSLWGDLCRETSSAPGGMKSGWIRRQNKNSLMSMKTNLHVFRGKKSVNRLSVGCILRAHTVLQAEHFFTFRFSVQTPQQSLKSPLERKSKDKKSLLYLLLNVLNAIYFNSTDIRE